MKKTILLPLLIVLSACSAFAQNESDSLHQEGLKFIYQGNRIGISEAMFIMDDSSPAYKKMSQALYQRNVSNTLRFAGGLSLGYALGQALAEEEINWFASVVGIGLLAVSIPFRSNARNNAHKAVLMHNSSLKKTGNATFYLRIQPGINGLKLAVRF